MSKFKPQNYILRETEHSTHACTVSSFAQIMSVQGDRYEVRFVMFRGFCSNFAGFGKPVIRTAAYIDRFTKTTRKHIMSLVGDR